MAIQTLLWVLSVLLVAWSRDAIAQDAESDVKSIPLRTHSLQTVRSLLPASMNRADRRLVALP